jgi:hypothetical protein
MAFAGLKKPKDRNDLIRSAFLLPPVNALYADCLVFSFFPLLGTVTSRNRLCVSLCGFLHVHSLTCRSSSDTNRLKRIQQGPVSCGGIKVNRREHRSPILLLSHVHVFLAVCLGEQMNACLVQNAVAAHCNHRCLLKFVFAQSSLQRQSLRTTLVYVAAFQHLWNLSQLRRAIAIRRALKPRTVASQPS